MFHFIKENVKRMNSILLTLLIFIPIALLIFVILPLIIRRIIFGKQEEEKEEEKEDNNVGFVISSKIINLK